jgi:hypothetical protein
MPSAMRLAQPKKNYSIKPDQNKLFSQFIVVYCIDSQRPVRGD